MTCCVPELVLLIMRLLPVASVLFITAAEFPDEGTGIGASSPEMRSSGNSLVKLFSRCSRPTSIYRYINIYICYIAFFNFKNNKKEEG